MDALQRHVANLAVAKAITPKETKESSSSVKPGIYDCTATISLACILQKGEDYEQTMPSKPNWRLLTELFASRVRKDTFQEIYDEYKKCEKKKKFDALQEKVKPDVQDKLEKLVKRNRIQANGKVSIDNVMMEIKKIKVTKMSK